MNPNRCDPSRPDEFAQHIAEQALGVRTATSESPYSDAEIISTLRRARWELEAAVNSIRAEMARFPDRPMNRCRDYQHMSQRRERLNALRDHWAI